MACEFNRFHWLFICLFSFIFSNIMIMNETGKLKFFVVNIQYATGLTSIKF